jgi:diphthamide synthase (EF-2-diphthine--ammonia ligase)
MKVLHCFSGGIDSTSVLYQLIHAGHEVVTLHIDICGAKGEGTRWPAEQKAVKRIIEWFAKEGHTFKHINGGRTELTGMWWDIEVTALHTGFNIRADKKIEATTDSYSATDAVGGCMGRNMNRWALTEMVALRKITWIKPNTQKSRTQVMKEMPVELLRLCHFCRSPIIEGENFKPCRKCHTCKWTMPYMESHNVI